MSEATPEAADGDFSTEVELMDREDLIPYSNNPKEHPESQVKRIASSIKNYGWDQPIVVDGEMEVIKGHGRLMAAERLGLEKVPVIVREDLTEAEARAARIADNKAAEAPWDEEMLQTEVEIVSEDYSAEDLGFEEDDFDALLEEIEADGEVETDIEYTDKIESPVYEPTGDRPPIEDLTSEEKALRLREKVEDADLPEEVEDFLKMAAMRHVVFDYENIAEWYAHADPEVQDLMEDLTLVIVDYDQAVEQGFVQFAKDTLENGVGNDGA
ncbi:ParB-like partition protein [Haloarcula hispanica tailed virus 2]|uniref:ParB-like N-terminal domain-containing protein n=1 Tax=Haloarcula hispanica tailed virus 2 TaxID=1273751 RepID=R4TG31_9CAUD|nr:ParB-like partition protein [Haloarcula hispanica tailed virus 2]AGM11186.1 hypothetical protein HHTV2_21 [Haloarcula hispanica tailed virus 2]